MMSRRPHQRFVYMFDRALFGTGYLFTSAVLLIILSEWLTTR